MADLSLLEDADYTDDHHDILLTIPTLYNLEDDEFDPDHDLGFISAHDFFSRRNLDRNPHPISSIHRNPLPIDRQNQVNFVIDMFHQRVEQSQFNSVLIQDNDNRNHNHNHNNRLIRSSNVDFGVGDDDNDVNWNEFDVGFDSGLGFLDFDCENPNCENRVCDHDDGDGVNGGSVYGFAEDDDDDDDNWGARVAPGSPEIVFGGLGVHLRVEDDSAVDDEASLHLCWDSLHLEDDDDDDNVVSNMHLSQDTTSLDDQAFTTEAALDRCILRLIASCCNGDKLVRAIELVKLLSLEKSVRGAIKLVTAMKLLNLAERFNTIFEERLLKEAAETMLKETTEPKSTTGTDTSKVFTSPEVCNAPEPVNEFPSVQLPSPSFVIKKTVEEPATVQLSSLLFMKKKNVEKPATVQLSSPLFVKKKTKEEAPKVVKVSHTKEITKPENKTPAKKIVGELKAGNNPFAKSSINNQEKTSLFDSLNKLKNNESSTTR